MHTTKKNHSFLWDFKAGPTFLHVNTLARPDGLKRDNQSMSERSSVKLTLKLTLFPGKTFLHVNVSSGLHETLLKQAALKRVLRYSSQWPILTYDTAIQLYPHWYPGVPRDRVKSEEAPSDWTTEPVAYNYEPIVVSDKELKKYIQK